MAGDLLIDGADLRDIPWAACSREGNPSNRAGQKAKIQGRCVEFHGHGPDVPAFIVLIQI
jgi:hypothetical protein